MYKLYLSGEKSLPSNMAWASEYIAHRAECVDRQTIDNLKKRNKLTEFSHELLDADADLEDADKLQFEGLFSVVLLCDSIARETQLNLIQE